MSMFDISSWLLHLCLTHSFCACAQWLMVCAPAHEALSLTFVIVVAVVVVTITQRNAGVAIVVVIVAIVQCNVENNDIVDIFLVVVAVAQPRIWNSLCAIAPGACSWHMVLLQPLSCCHCCRCVTRHWNGVCLCTRLVVVTVVQPDVEMACACAQGLVGVTVMWCDVENGVHFCTRPCHLCRHATQRWKWCVLVHKALLSLLLCDTMGKCMGHIKLKLCAHARWLMHGLHLGWESSCSSAQWLWLMHLRKGRQLLLNCHCVIVDCCFSNDDSQYKSLCACTWGALCWHMLFSKPSLLLLPLHYTMCK